MNNQIEFRLQHGMYELKDGFIFSHMFKDKINIKDAIYIHEEISSNHIDYINKKHIDKIIIDGFIGTTKSLEPLKKINHVIYLSVEGDFDVTPLYALKELRYLSISSSQKLDLSQFPQLEWFSTGTTSCIVNLDKSEKLKSLTIYNRYMPLEPEVAESISSLPQLDTLVIAYTEIINLDFLKPNMNLQVLVLVDNKKLSNIDAIVNIKDSLKHLKIFVCKKIESYDCLEKMDSLVFIMIQMCKSLKDIYFANRLKNLHSFIISDTQIENGDLTPLMNKKCVIVMPLRKFYHYNKNENQILIKHEDLPQLESRQKGEDQIDSWRRINHH